MAIKKILLTICGLFILALPVLAQTNDGTETFSAVVVKILEERQMTSENGETTVQQNILLRGLKGDWMDKEFEYIGISDLQMAGSNSYKSGDKVMVQVMTSEDGETHFLITDFVRQGYLYFLVLLFAVVVVIIGRMKGVRALIGLAISFLVIVKIILPLILTGYNPLTIGVLGSFIILTLIIYLAEGWNKKSHLAIVSVIVVLGIIVLLSFLFSNLTRLTGFAQEEVVFLTGIGTGLIDFKGLLLAGILIGAVGVLDDVIVGQIEAVYQIKEINPTLSSLVVFRSAYQVGNTHLSAIVNTLFLTYAGASLPLLILFSINKEPFTTFSQVINNEVIATEIVRTFVGSIGVALAMPIATFLAVYFLKVKAKK